MARKKQQLINYHTGSLTSMPLSGDVQLGELVVRHATDKPELLIKKDNNEFATFVDSGKVQSMITTSSTDLQGKINAISNNLRDNYATSADTEAAIGAAKKEVYDSATSFTTKEVNTLSTTISEVRSDLTELSGVVESISTNIGENYVTTDTLNTTVEELKGKISAAQKAATDASSAYTDSKITISETKTKGLIDGVASDLKDLKTTVENDYVLTTTLNTKVEELETKISTAKDDAISSGKTYTDAQITAAKEYSDNKLTAATATLTQSITAVSSSVSTLSGNVHTRIEGLKTNLTETINDKITNVYRYKGSCAYAELPTTGNVTGDVWNVTDAHDKFPAGTNYAWNDTEWDALGGSVDLSPYAKTEDVNKSITNLNSKVGEFSSATVTEFASLKKYAGDTYATKTELEATSGSIITAYTTAISNAKKAVYDSATTVAAADAKTKADTAYSSAVTAAAASAETLNTSIKAVDNKVTGLSASTVTIQGVANTAVQTASIVGKDTCKVSVNKVGTELQFNFENLVVDCGDF